MAFKILSLVFLVVSVYGFPDGEWGYEKYEEAPIGKDGSVIDTPEVAKLKDQHYEAYLDQVHHVKKPDVIIKEVPVWHHVPEKVVYVKHPGWDEEHYRGGYEHYPIDKIVYQPYTHEVEKARQDHFKTYDAIVEHQKKYYHR